MKTIKIIDILNKIAKGEEVPKKIKYEGKEFEYNEYQEDYFNKEYMFGVLDKIRLFSHLNNEVEIIEEDKWDYTMRQISKMIASGDLKNIYEKYLSNCPIGFMKEEDIYNYILKNVEVEVIEEEQDIEEILEIELLGQGDNWLQNTQSKDKLESVELNPYILKVITRNFELLYEKQCELIKAVNELKKNER